MSEPATQFSIDDVGHILRSGQSDNSAQSSPRSPGDVVIDIRGDSDILFHLKWRFQNASTGIE
jgi:hypothetical protein